MRKLLVGLTLLGLRLTQLVSPRPTALLVRYIFAKGDAATAARLRPSAPTGASVMSNVRYGDAKEATYDVYLPSSPAPDTTLPTIVWTPGGAFVGGNNKTMDYYFKKLATAGLAVVAVGYTRAPEARYPTPPRQLISALRHLTDNAAQLPIDVTRLVLAGDSAGAHITAQVAMAITDPSYGALVGLLPSVRADQLRGVILCCGVYDLAALRGSSPIAPILDAIGWAYSGIRRFAADRRFADEVSLPRHVTAAFPRTFMTVGNADPLRPQTAAMADALRAAGVSVETLTYPDDHVPPLNHEYQFDLELADAMTAFDRIVGFVSEETRLG